MSVDPERNFFVLHRDPKVAAQMLCDAHVERVAEDCAIILSDVAHLIMDELIALRIERSMLEGKKEPLRPVHTTQRGILWPKQDEIDRRDADNQLDRMLGLQSEIPLPKTDPTHPCVTWARRTEPNWQWLLQHAWGVCAEYTFRHKVPHPSLRAVQWLRYHSPKPSNPRLTSWPLIMPAQYHRKKLVWSYRAYYWGEKREIAKWEHGRTAPRWWRSRETSSLRWDSAVPSEEELNP